MEEFRLVRDGRALFEGSHLACLQLIGALERNSTPITSDIGGARWHLYGYIAAARFRRLWALRKAGAEVITLNGGMTYRIEKNS